MSDSSHKVATAAQAAPTNNLQPSRVSDTGASARKKNTTQSSDKGADSRAPHPKPKKASTPGSSQTKSKMAAPKVRIDLGRSGAICTPFQAAIQIESTACEWPLAHSDLSIFRSATVRLCSQILPFLGQNSTGNSGRECN